MKPEDIAKAAQEAKEIKDMQDDRRDIETIFANFNAGYGYDRNKAEAMIHKYNVSDPYVFVRNCNPATAIPLPLASDQTILDNLNFLHSYLSVKLTAKLAEEAEKENKNAHT